MVRVHFKVVTLVIDDICSPDVVDRGYEQLGEAIYMIVNYGHGTLDVSTIGHIYDDTHQRRPDEVHGRR